MQQGADRVREHDQAVKAHLDGLKQMLYDEFERYRQLRKAKKGWTKEVGEFEHYLQNGPQRGTKYTQHIVTAEDLRTQTRTFAETLYVFYNPLWGGSTLRENLLALCDNAQLWQLPQQVARPAPQSAASEPGAAAGAAAGTPDDGLKAEQEEAEVEGDAIDAATAELEKLALEPPPAGQDTKTDTPPPAADDSTAAQLQRRVDAQQAQIEALQRRLAAMPKTPPNSPVPTPHLAALSQGVFFRQRTPFPFGGAGLGLGWTAMGAGAGHPPADADRGHPPADADGGHPPSEGGGSPRTTRTAKPGGKMSEVD